MQKYEVTYDWILTIKAAGTPPTEVCVWCAYSRAEQGLHNLGHLFHSEVKYNNLAKDHTWSWRAKFTSDYAMVWFSAVIKSTLFSLLSNKACKKKKERKKKTQFYLFVHLNHTLRYRLILMALALYTYTGSVTKELSFFFYAWPSEPQDFLTRSLVGIHFTYSYISEQNFFLYLHPHSHKSMATGSRSFIGSLWRKSSCQTYNHAWGGGYNKKDYCCWGVQGLC